MKNNCIETSCKKLYSFKEHNSKLILENINQVESTTITVDGCEINDKKTIRCDYLHIAKNIEMYIELKGQNIKQAIAQIENTIKKLSTHVQNQPKRSYIICSRSPLTSTEIQQYTLRFRKNFNAQLIIKESGYKDKY